MRSRGFAGLAVLVFGALLVAPPLARADLVVKERVETQGFMGMWTSRGTETSYIKGEKIRNESETKTEGGMPGMMPGGMPKAVSIMRLDKGLTWIVNDADSTYQEITMKQLTDTLASITKDAKQPPIKVKEVTVKKTGETKTIAGYKCDGVLVKVAIESIDDQKPMTFESQTLLWTTPQVKDLEELSKFWDRLWEESMASMENSQMSDFIKPMWEKMKAVEGVILGMEMTLPNLMGGISGQDKDEMKEAMKMMKQYMKGAKGGEEGGEAAKEPESDGMKMTREITSISKSKLNDSLFEIPAGYKKSSQSMMEMYKPKGGMPAKP